MTRRLSHRRRRGGALAALLTLLALAVVTVGAYSPRVAGQVPGLSGLLALVSGWLPAHVAWMHDPGSPSLRSGAYFGWTDGHTGELYLYGEGCGQAGTAGLSLRGGGVEVELTPRQVVSESMDLGLPDPVPLLRLTIALTRPVAFDRALLRCRDGAEAAARIAAAVALVAPAASSGEHTAGLVTLSGPVARPALGFVGELSVVAATRHLTLQSVVYAHAAAATGVVKAAAGHPAAREAWLWTASSGQTATPKALSPWDLGYASLTGLRSMRARPAAELALPLAPTDVALLLLPQTAFRATAVPRPVVSKLVLSFDIEGVPYTAVPGGLAFGWTAPP